MHEDLLCVRISCRGEKDLLDALDSIVEVRFDEGRGCIGESSREGQESREDPEFAMSIVHGNSDRR